MFVVVEQKEPHAGRMAFESIAQPATFAERCTLAKRLRDELEVPLPIFVDGMDDASRALFSDLPSPAFVIDRDGRIADKLPWADATQLQPILQRVLATPLPDANARTQLAPSPRHALARRLLLAGKTADALAVLDLPPAAGAPPTDADRAQLALTRAAAVRKADAPVRKAAVAAARDAITAAWRDDRARLVAARVELAEAAAGLDDAADLWQAALRDVDARAPTTTRDWLTQRRGK